MFLEQRTAATSLAALLIFATTVFISTTAAFAKTSAGPRTQVRVMIDPGHGGQDDGAVKNGVFEKTITLQVSLELKKLLDRDPRFKALLTRNQDVYVPLDQRSQMARDQRADVFISIHANSSTASSARGTEIYFENQIPTDEEDMLLANRENAVVQGPSGDKDITGSSDLKNIMTDLAHNEHMVLSQQLSQILLASFQKDFDIKTRAIRQAPFRVLEVNIPATLIELGFITNPTEARWLAAPKDQKKMAKAIYKALRTFKEKLDKVHSAPVN